MFHFNQMISFILQLVDLNLVCHQAIFFEFLYTNRNNIKWDVENVT